MDLFSVFSLLLPLLGTSLYFGRHKDILQAHLEQVIWLDSPDSVSCDVRWQSVIGTIFYLRVSLMVDSFLNIYIETCSRKDFAMQ
jgi:hypothetical protein